MQQCQKSAGWNRAARPGCENSENAGKMKRIQQAMNKFLMEKLLGARRLCWQPTPLCPVPPPTKNFSALIYIAVILSSTVAHTRTFTLTKTRKPSQMKAKQNCETKGGLQYARDSECKSLNKIMK